jgi:hypothetical protein
VYDVNGNALSATPVSFSTTAGNLNSTFVVTDGNGFAQVVLTTSVQAVVTASAGATAVPAPGAGNGGGAGGGTTTPTTPTSDGHRVGQCNGRRCRLANTRDHAADHDAKRGAAGSFYIRCDSCGH